MMQIRLLLVDDHPVVRQGYTSYLEQVLSIEIAEAGSGKQAYTTFVVFRPDVTVLDVSLPDVSGLEVLRRIRRRDPEAKVLVFTIHDSPLLVEKALQGGALGYLTKSCNPKLLVEALQQVMQGERFVEPALLETVSRSPQSLLKRLTLREFEVFQLLAQGRSVAEIAGLLNLSPKTVGVHQTRILHKLDLPSPVHLVLLAVRCGLVKPTV